MRIISQHEPVLDTLAVIDQHITDIQNALRLEFNATDTELNWFATELKKWFGTDLINGTRGCNWDNILKRAKLIFRYARETETVLTGDMFDLMCQMDNWTIKKTLLKVLEENERLARTLGEPEASNAFNPADIATQKGSIFLQWLNSLDLSIADGLSHSEIAWYAEKYLGSSQAVLPAVGEARLFLEEIRSRSQKIKEVTYNQARDIMRNKAEYAMRANSAKRLPQQEIVKRFRDGWTVVKVKDGSDRSMEEEIVGHRLTRDDTEIFSVHDQNNVPMALIEYEISDIDPKYIGACSRSEPMGASDRHFKEFMMELKSVGMRPVWIESEAYHPTLKDVEEAVDDKMGVGPYISGYGGSVDAYVENFKTAYSDAWSGSYYYSGQARKWVDVIGTYALERGEEKMFDAAIDEFSDYAQELWGESDYDILNANGIKRPEEEDEEFQDSKGNFNQKKYDKAMEEFYVKEQEVQDDFEPFTFMSLLIEESKNLKKLRTRQRRGVGKKKKDIEFQKAVQEGLANEDGGTEEEPIEDWLSQSASRKTPLHLSDKHISSKIEKNREK